MAAGLQLGLLALCTWLLPLCLGLAPVRFMKKEHQSLGMVWLAGWFMMFAAFQVMAVPFIAAQASYHALVHSYTIGIAALALLSLLIGHGCIGPCMEKARGSAPEKGQLPLMLLVIGLIVLQMFFAFHMQYLDGDDSFYVAASLTSQHTDTMYRYTPYYGADGELDIRHALSTAPVFLAWLSDICGIHVTILCHSYISILFLFLMYCIYGQLGKQLFPMQRKNQWVFLLLLNLWYLFGNVSIYTPESFAYTRTWQGKAMFPNLMIPALFLWLIFIAKEEMDAGEWGLLFILVTDTVFTTSTGIFTVPILLFLAALIVAVSQKRAALVFQIGACLMPSVFYGLLYLFLK